MKKFSRVVIGGILITIGCGCFLYPNFREWNTQREVDQIIEKFDNTYSESLELESKQTPTTKPIKNSKDATHGDDGVAEIAHNDSLDDSLDAVVDNDSTEEVYDSRDLESLNDTFKNSDSIPTARPYQSLYDEMVKYNQDLSDNGQDIVDAWSYEQQPFDLSNNDLIGEEVPVVGYIDIPDMQIRLPLMLGASPENLEKGAAVLSETSMPIGGDNTNCVIAGHRGWEGSAYFQYVENMKHGSKVYITNPWETLVYECTDIKVIYPDDVGSILIQPGKDMITLFTCHPYRLGGGPYRYLVFCERVDTQKRVSTEGHKVINPKVNDNEMIPSMTAEEMDGLQLDEINDFIDEREAEREIKTEQKKETENKTENINQIPAAELTADKGIDLLALEQTLRYFLPIALIIFTIIIVLFRHITPKKNKKKKKGDNNNRKRRTKI